MAGPRYLLDTNILSDLVKRPAGPVARKIAAVGEAAVCTSVVVACELRYGVAKKGSSALADKIDALLAALGVLPLETGADARYGEIRDALEKAGIPIGGNDLLIAAHALSLGLTLVTDNVAEFSRVEGLMVANWLRDEEG
jgi:tRNA(fMet)-specific endonuclease VapC